MGPETFSEKPGVEDLLFCSAEVKFWFSFIFFLQFLNLFKFSQECEGDAIDIYGQASLMPVIN